MAGVFDANEATLGALLISVLSLAWCAISSLIILPEIRAARDGDGTGRANASSRFIRLARRGFSLQEISSFYQTRIDLEKKFAIKSNAEMQKYPVLLLPNCVASLPSHP